LPENARILHNNCPKNIFSDFFFLGGGERAPPCLPSPTPMRKVAEFNIQFSQGSAATHLS